jgi:protoporphyrinogen oxidase
MVPGGPPQNTPPTRAWWGAPPTAPTTRLGTFEGGFQKFADLFAERLGGMGVTIRLSTPVTHIGQEAGGGSGLALETAAGTERYDKVLVTLAPAALAKMAPSLPKDYLEGLLRLKSMGAVVMVLSLKHRLSEEGYYWYNLPKSAGYPFLALVEHTNYVSPEHFGGDHIVYVGDYLEPEHEFFRLSQEELLERFLPSLEKFNPKFERGWVNKAWLFRTAYAQPVPLVNHSQNIPEIKTPVDGLYFASMSQVYPWDRGTNFAVEIGRRAAELMMD